MYIPRVKIKRTKQKTRPPHGAGQHEPNNGEKLGGRKRAVIQSWQNRASSISAIGRFDLIRTDIAFQRILYEGSLNSYIRSRGKDWFILINREKYWFILIRMGKDWLFLISRGKDGISHQDRCRISFRMNNRKPDPIRSNDGQSLGEAIGTLIGIEPRRDFGKDGLRRRATAMHEAAN